MHDLYNRKGSNYFPGKIVRKVIDFDTTQRKLKIGEKGMRKWIVKVR